MSLELSPHGCDTSNSGYFYEPICENPVTMKLD